jgi:hypothetical protein
MSHRSSKHEAAYRKGKKALDVKAAAKAAAAQAATEFLKGSFKTVVEAAKKYKVDDMAVHRRIRYLLIRSLFLCTFSTTSCLTLPLKLSPLFVVFGSFRPIFLCFILYLFIS